MEALVSRPLSRGQALLARGAVEAVQTPAWDQAAQAEVVAGHMTLALMQRLPVQQILEAAGVVVRPAQSLAAQAVLGSLSSKFLLAIPRLSAQASPKPLPRSALTPSIQSQQPVPLTP